MTVNYIVYNQAGKIMRTGVCDGYVLYLQAGDREFAMEGIANDATQKVKFDGFDEKGQPINPRVVDKTPQEIIDDTPEPEPEEEMITKKKWKEVLDRISVLESEV